MEKQPVYEEQDYVVVNEMVWKLLSSLYGGGPEISEKARPLSKQIHILAASSSRGKDEKETPLESSKVNSRGVNRNL